MAIGVTNRKHYEAIAQAIRAKNGEATTYKPSEMAGAILAIEGGGANLAKVAEVAIYESIGQFAITYEDGRLVIGSVTFDALDNNPISLEDDQGNSVEFSNGYPVRATDAYGNIVPIVWG